MKALVLGDLALLNGQVWRLGCTCTRPRRRKGMPQVVSEDTLKKLKEYGKEEEVR